MSNAVEKAKEYYDSSEADNFYYHVWGGTDIHVGLYDEPGVDIASASAKTVEFLTSRMKRLLPSGVILDIGSGYGGAARHLADHGYLVDCLNISAVQNRRNQELTQAEGLHDSIRVFEGSFQEMPFENAVYDVVWSQDAIVHSSDRERVFQEVDRVLKPGGYFIFTDLMATPECPEDVLQNLVTRIHLSDMGSPERYSLYAGKLGWSNVEADLKPEHAASHYKAVYNEIETRRSELERLCSPDYINTMESGLLQWVEAAKSGHITWGVLIFQKAE